MKPTGIRQTATFIVLILSLKVAAGQTLKGTTDAGKRVILNSNGTWKYDPQDTSGTCNCQEMAAVLKEQRIIAVKQTQVAQHLERAALREHYLAVANAMAIKSKELRDPELKALLALQAFNFNDKYSGYRFNNNIYNGIYAALNTFGDPLTRSLNEHRYAVRTLATNVKDSTIFSGGVGGKIIGWKFRNNEWSGKTIVAERPGYQIYSIDVSPDGTLLAVGGHVPNSHMNYVELYNLKGTHNDPKRVSGYIGDIDNIHFTPDSNGMYARCNSGHSVLYSDFSTTREVITSTEKINAFDLSADGLKLAGGDERGNVYVWDVANNYSLTSYHIFNARPVAALAFIPNSRDLAVGNDLGDVLIWVNGVVKRNLSGHTSSIEQIKFSHSGRFMATSSKDGTTRLWNLSMLNEQPLVLTDYNGVCSIAFSADDRYLMTGLQSVQVSLETIQFAMRAWPTDIPVMASHICTLLKRNMTKDEWLSFASDLPYEKTCPDFPMSK